LALRSERNEEGSAVRKISVTTPDGLTIAGGEWGNPAGPEIVFLHGYMQCSLSWRRQLADPLLTAEFRMIAYDLRGHGQSDKPADRESYAHDRLWADEAAAVIAAAGLKRPVLVGWSYSGRVVSDYLRFHGAGSLAGVNFVNAVTRSGTEFFGPDHDLIPATFSEDLEANIRGTRAFLSACFSTQPLAGDFETMMAFNMLCPARVRAAVMSRTSNPGDMLARLTVPVLVTHGADDRIILPTMAEFTAGSAAKAELSLYDGSLTRRFGRTPPDSTASWPRLFVPPTWPEAEPERTFELGLVIASAISARTSAMRSPRPKPDERRRRQKGRRPISVSANIAQSPIRL
jgi:pimeloyl-ACP methyl ester carboxylesterase